MEIIIERAKKSFKKSRKLQGIEPSKEQLDNVKKRIEEIFTDEELSEMSDKEFIRQVERVWPIAKYVDQND